MTRTLSILLLLIGCASELAASTSVNGNITTDTTWNAAGSPYLLSDNLLTGGTDITVQSGATLTIDAASGNVVIEFTGRTADTDFDLVIGSGGGSAGALVIKASGGTITFKMKTGCNLLVTADGSMNVTDSTYATSFTRFGTGKGQGNPGAVVFEAGQTKSSSLKNCSFSYLGYDSKDGALYVKSSATYVPRLENLSFDNCNTSAIRMDSNGINVLKEGNVTLPLSITNTTYVLYLSAVASTAARIVFPDPTTPDSPSFKLAGTNRVGDSSNPSGWTFIDSCTFKCASSSAVQIVNGYVWGSSEARPTFENDTGSASYSHWVGLVDDSSTKVNRFGDTGPFAYITVRDATTAFDINKGTSYVPESGTRTLWRFPGLIAKKCGTGIRVRTHRETTGVNAGYTTLIENAEIGASSSSDDCSTACILVDHGRALLDRCQVNGTATTGVKIGTTSVTNTYDVSIRDCSITDSDGSEGVLIDSSQGSGSVTIERTRIEGYSYGVSFFQTTTGSYTPTRSLSMRHCFVSADPESGGETNAVRVNVQTAAACTLLIEDCTIAGSAGGSSGYGFRFLELRSSSSLTARRTNIDSNQDYGVYVDSATNNTCEYTFDECSITGNGGSGTEGGIHDARSQTARVVASHCTFAANSPYNAYDANGGSAATNMLAENCYWNSTSGAGATVNSNVDASPYLARPYIGWLIGGSPAGVSALGVNNATGATTYADQLHIIDDDAIAVKWTFASDFSGSTQSAYEIDIDNDPDFGSLTYNGSKTTSSSSDISVSITMSAGTVYYVRVQLYDANDRAGPRYFHTFRTNTAPPAVGNTNRSPSTGATLTDSTPTFYWQCAVDADEDPIHFTVFMEYNVGGFPVTWNALVSYSSTSTYSAGGFEYSTDGGATYVRFPSTGLPAGSTWKVRFTAPTSIKVLLGAVSASEARWRVSNTDGFEGNVPSDSDAWTFTFSLSSAFSGRLTSDGSTGIGNVTVKLYVNGTYDTSTTTDNSGGPTTGDFTLTSTTDILPGDILFIFRDGGGSTTRAIRVVQFSGANMTGLDLQYKRAYIQQTMNDPIVNTDFAIITSDSDIPWTYAAGVIQFSGDLQGSGDGVHLSGAWDLTEDVDASTNDAEFHVNSGAVLRTLGHNIDVHLFDNEGTTEVTGGSRLMVDGSNSTSSGTLRVYSSTLRLKKSGGITLTVDKGTAEFRNSTLDVDTGDVSNLTIDTADATGIALAILDCTGTTFSKVGMTIEADGIVAAFNDNVFSGGISTRHMYWKATDARTVTTFRGTQFNYALGPGEFNVEAGGAGVLVLSLVRSGGACYGEGYDKNGGSEGDSLDNRVLWTLMPPWNVATVAGDTRVRITWTADDQADLSGAGYDVYRSTSEGGSYSKINGSLITSAYYNDSSLSNGSTYWYYVKCVDTNTTPDTESGGSARVSATPAAASALLVTPDTAYATSIFGPTLIGSKTHWDGSTTNNLSGTGISVNDTIYLSPALALYDITLSGASTGLTTFSVEASDVWGIAAYDESVDFIITISANPPDEDERPTLTFSTSNGGIAADANTSGSFVLNVDFTDNGGGIDTTALQVYASRNFEAKFGGSVSTISAGTNVIAAGVVPETLTDSRMTWTIEQSTASNGNELFSNGEYTVYARIADDNGLYSEWVTRRFYVEGAGTNVVICATTLLQGTTMDVTLNGTSLSGSQTIDFGSNITVNSASGSGGSITVNVTVAESAACGPRTITTNNGSKSGIAIVEYRTNIKPANTASEPSRNPAIGSLNVFLHTGEFFKSETDLAVRGRMAGISWSRFYRSGAASYNGPLGHGWMGFYYQWCYYDGANIIWKTPDLRSETFTGVTGGFSSPVGVYVRATRDSTFGTITLTDRHGHRCVFNSNGRLWKCIDRNGNTIECTYNYVGQLTTITNDLGETFTIAYTSAGFVDTVSDNMWNDGSSGHTAARQIEYAYDSNGDLTEQKAPTTSRYDGSPLPRISYMYRYIAHRLTECVNPKEAAQGGTPASYMENQYEYDGSRWQVVAQRLGGQDQWLYTRYVSSTSVRCIDRRGLRTDYTLDASGRATTVRRYTKIWSVDTDESITHSTVTEVSGKINAADPDYFDTVMTYNANHEVLTVTYPRGNKATYTYAYSAASQTSGTATSCSANVLTKTSAGWTPSAYVGMTLRMGSDAGNYRYYAITANTSDTITVNSTFSLSDDGWGASAYAVHNLSPDPLAAGNVMTVTRSDEALGAEADIVTTYTYEPRYQFVKTVSDPRNSSWLTTYTYDYEESASTTDAFGGNLVKVETPTVTQSMASSATIVTRTTYNEYGQPVCMIDGEGNVTLLKYYTAGSHKGFLYQRISAYGSLDLTTEFDYDPVGNLTAQWPPRAFEAGATKDDFKTTYEVNELNQTWHVQGPKLRIGGSERVDSYAYFDANGLQTHSFREYTTDAGTEKTLPNSTQVLDPSWFASEKATTAMSATWVESRSVFDILGRVLERTVDAVANSVITQYTSYSYYDADDNVITSLSPLGNMSKSILDERNLTYQSISGANSDVASTYTSTYDANGNISTSKDARGYSTTYTYDGFDRTTRVIDPAGHYRTTTYDANSNMLYSRSYSSANELLTQSLTTYDEINRAWKTETLAKDHNGVNIGDGLATNTTVFDKNSRTVSSTDDNGVSHITFYDAASRVTYTRDAVGNEVHNTYNLNGAVTLRKYREINGLNNVMEVSHEEYELDLADRVTKFRDRRYNVLTMDTETESKYDGWGRVTQTTDAANVTTDYSFDLLSRSTRTIRKPSATEAEWIVTDTTYDAGSRVSRRTVYETGDAVSPTDPQNTDYTYDERNRLITLRRPDGDIWTYTYDANSNQKGWTDPLGTQVVNSYDNRNLLTSRIINCGSGVEGATSEAYAYDGLGRLISCSNYHGSNLISANVWYYNTMSSAERVDQTVANGSGGIEGTWTMKSEFDATGFNTATIFSDGRRIEHTPDQLNRLLMSYDVTNGKLIAEYAYAGPSRLIQSICGNGIVTTYEYEAAGCGCGGFSSYCEKVEATHADDPTTPLFTNDRRYDAVGNVTAERQGHTGGFGGVYRYDNAYRLTDTYSGVDLADASSDDIDTMADPGSTPGAFGKHTSYNMDTRGNRTGSGGMLQESDTFMGGSTYTIYSTDYTAPSGDKMNLYDSVDGQSFTYDAIEQMTSNPMVHHDGLTYDYKGQTVSQGDGVMKLINQFDCQGRKVYYATDDTSAPDYSEILLNENEGGGGCSCSSGNNDTKKEVIIKQDGSIVGIVQYVKGQAVAAAGSGSATHPATAATPSMGRGQGNVVMQEYYPMSETLPERWIAHDQLGSTAACFDENGDQCDEYTYDAWGQAFWTQVLVDGAPRNVSSVVHDGISGITSVTMASSFANNPADAVIRVARPNEAGAADRLLHFPVLSTSGGNTILVDDASQVFYGIVNGGERFTVLGFYNKVTGGTWYDVPVYDSGTDTTTFYGEAWNIGGGTAMEEQGTTLVPDVQKPVHLTILSITVNTGADNDEIVVRGRADDLATDIDRFFIHVPPRFVNDPNDGSGQDAYAVPERGGSLYLYAGYRYEMRRSGGTLGSPQANTGWYYCWNRMYDPQLGRFTSPDPAATPWNNLSEYANGNPVASSDASGLFTLLLTGTNEDGTPGVYSGLLQATAFGKGEKGNLDFIKDSLRRMGMGSFGKDRWGLDAKLVSYNWVMMARKAGDEICAARKKNAQEAIRILGYSRGGALALVLAKLLEICGCDGEKAGWNDSTNTPKLPNIMSGYCKRGCAKFTIPEIQFMGLIDPVSTSKSDINDNDPFVPTEVPKNVKKAVVYRATSWSPEHEAVMEQHPVALENPRVTERKYELDHTDRKVVGSKDINDTADAGQVLKDLQADFQ